MASFMAITAKIPSAKEIRSAFGQPIGIIARTNTQAVAQVADDAVKLGRNNISANGKFRGAWVSGLRARKYPKRKATMSPQAWISHRFGGLASVFEFGTTTRPKKKTYMWLPLPGAPKRTSLSANLSSGRLSKSTARTTPGRISEKNGGLVYLKGPSGKPLLGIQTGKGKNKRFKPLFVGIKFASIRKRWNVQDIIREQAARLPALIESELNKAAKD